MGEPEKDQTSFAFIYHIPWWKHPWRICPGQRKQVEQPSSAGDKTRNYTAQKHPIHLCNTKPQVISATFIFSSPPPINSIQPEECSWSRVIRFCSWARRSHYHAFAMRMRITWQNKYVFKGKKNLSLPLQSQLLFSYQCNCMNEWLCSLKPPLWNISPLPCSRFMCSDAKQEGLKSSTQELLTRTSVQHQEHYSP